MEYRKKTVKSCKNCSISELWVQITGMPGEDRGDPANPYPLFNNLKKALTDKYDDQILCKILPKKNNPVLLNIQTGPHKVSILPPSWNGEINWMENSQRKILRAGHQFFSLHSFFNKAQPYVNYRSSFEKTLKEVIDYIDDSNIFEAAQISICYTNA